MLEYFSKLRFQRTDTGFRYDAKRESNTSWILSLGPIDYQITDSDIADELSDGQLQVIDNPLADAINSHYTGEQVINIKVDTAGVMDELTAGIVAEANARAQADAELGKRIEELRERIEPSSAETVPQSHQVLSPTIWQIRRAKSITIRGKIATRENPSHLLWHPLLRGGVEDLVGESVTIEYFSDEVWQAYAAERFTATRERQHKQADVVDDVRDTLHRQEQVLRQIGRELDGWYDNLR